MRRLLTVAALLAALPATVYAQGAMMGRGPLTPQASPTPPREPPQGLPGVAARRGQRPIPAEADPAGMNPNDALFDGINRGDIATVRDAIARGADVNARNALGLTALESAVDQGRPEITVYLLSVRGTGSAPPPDASHRGAAIRSVPSPREAPRRETGRREASAPAQPAAPARPRLFGNDGGSPRPEIGFLGFDAGRG